MKLKKKKICMQYYTDNHAEGHTGNKDDGMDTRKFFLNSLCLLLGRFDSKKFESTMSEYGMQISRALLSQVCILEFTNKHLMVHSPI